MKVYSLSICFLLNHFLHDARVFPELHVFFCVTALDSSSNDSYGVWKIDDKDNSFLTQPFRIKYARQDVRLCMMVSFTMPLERYEVLIFSLLSNVSKLVGKILQLVNDAGVSYICCYIEL